MPMRSKRTIKKNIPKRGIQMKKSKARIFALATTMVFIWIIFRVLNIIFPPFQCGCASPCPILTLQMIEPLVYVIIVGWAFLDIGGWFD